MGLCQGKNDRQKVQPLEPELITERQADFQEIVPLTPEPEVPEPEPEVNNNDGIHRQLSKYIIKLKNTEPIPEQKVVYRTEVVEAVESLPPKRTETEKQRKKKINTQQAVIRQIKQEREEVNIQKKEEERKKESTGLENVAIEPSLHDLTKLSSKKWKKTVSFDGIDYGELVSIGDQLWLNKNLEQVMQDGKKVSVAFGKGPGKNGENESRYLPSCVKPGIRLPTGADFEKLFETIGGKTAAQIDALKDSKGFNLQFNDKMVQVTSESAGDNMMLSYLFDARGIRKDQSWTYANSGDLAKYGVRLICDSKIVNTSELIGHLKQIKPSNEQKNTVMVNEVSNLINLDAKKTQSLNLYEIQLSVDLSPEQENSLVCWEFPGGFTTTGRTVKHYFDMNANPNDSVKQIKVQIEGSSLIMQDILNLDLNTLGDNEVADGIDYGVPVIVGTQMWLNKSVEYAMYRGKKVCLIEGKGPGEGGENEIDYVKSCAPMGWRPPMLQDLKKLVDSLPQDKQIETLRLKSGFALNNKKIATIEKKEQTDYYAMSFGGSKPNLNDRAWGYANSGDLAKYGVRLLSDAVTKPTSELIGSMKSTLPRLPGNKTMIKTVTGLIGIKMKQRTGKGNHKIVWILQKELKDLTGRVAWSFGDGTEVDGKEVKHTYKYEIDFNVVIQLEAATCVYQESFTFNPGNVGDSEIYDGLDFGLPIKIGKQIWLNKDVEFLYNAGGVKLSCLMGQGPGKDGENESTHFFRGVLPPGWRLPSKTDYETLMNNLKGDQKQKALELRNPSAFNLELFNGSSIKKLMTCDKVKGDDNNYHALFVDIDSFSFGKVWKYSNSKSLGSYGARLIADDSPELMQEGDQDVKLKESCELKLKNQNIEKISWKLPDGSTSNEISFTKNFENLNWGSHEIAIEAHQFGGRKAVKKIKTFFYTAKAATRVGKFDKSKIQIIEVSDEAFNSGTLHFERPSGVIVPNMEDGGFLFGLNHKDGTKSVSRYDNKGNLIEGPKSHGQGKWQSICQTEWGYACMQVESGGKKNMQECAAYDKNHKEKWKTLIMDNGDEPKKATKQLAFYNDKKEPFFGQRAMYNPHNSCIYYAREKIYTIFAHYNNFDGVKDCHTGDTTYSFNSNNGKDECYGTTWGSSHSLEQHIYYENGWAYTVTLGDAWPQDIRMYKTHIHKLVTSHSHDPTRKRNCFLMNSTKDLLTTEGNDKPMPGAGDGTCSGRAGGLVSLDENHLAIVYSRVPGTFKLKDGSIVSHNEDELGILIVTKDKMEVKKKIKLRSGKDINQIRMTRYGDKIFLAYFFTDNQQKDNGMLGRHWFESSNMHAFILDLKLNLIDDVGEIEGVKFNYNENFVTLNDGSVGWTHTDSNRGGPIKIYILRP